MTPFVIGNIQFTLSLVVYTCIAVWYVYPALKKKEWHKAMVPLLLTQVFRYGPLTMLMPGQVGSEIPHEIAETIAFGDLISGILTIIAMFFLWYKIKGSKILLWLFTIVGLGDIVFATAKGVGAGLIDMPMGFNLYILNFYVPLIIVTHIMIVLLLIKKK